MTNADPDQKKQQDQAAMARRLVRTLDGGILSTLSVDVPGYPFGSVTPYALTSDGYAVIYVSSIAQHTQNMLADPKVCLTVASAPGVTSSRQALGRVTIVGDARPVPTERVDAVSERYFQFFPESRAYASTHDFTFYWIEPRRIRHIAGFGQIFWVEADEWLQEAPEWQPGEAGIIQHMNSDHADAVERIAAYLLELDEPTIPGAKLIAVDPEGFHVRTSYGVLYGAFAERSMTTEAIRASFVQLSKESATV